MSRIGHAKVKEYSENTFFGTNPTMSQFVDAFVSDNTLRKVLDKVSGIKMTEAQARANYGLGLLMFSPKANQTFSSMALANTPIKTVDRHMIAGDIVPEAFRYAYYHRGESSKEDQDRYSKMINANTHNVSRKTYQQLRDYVENSEFGYLLHPILKEAGVLSIEGGRRKWAKHLSLDRASLLTGLSSRELYDARRECEIVDCRRATALHR